MDTTADKLCNVDDARTYYLRNKIRALADHTENCKRHLRSINTLMQNGNKTAFHYALPVSYDVQIAFFNAVCAGLRQNGFSVTIDRSTFSRGEERMQIVEWSYDLGEHEPAGGDEEEFSGEGIPPLMLEPAAEAN